MQRKMTVEIIVSTRAEEGILGDEKFSFDELKEYWNRIIEHGILEISPPVYKEVTVDIKNMVVKYSLMELGKDTPEVRNVEQI